MYVYICEYTYIQYVWGCPLLTMWCIQSHVSRLHHSLMAPNQAVTLKGLEGGKEMKHLSHVLSACMYSTI